LHVDDDSGILEISKEILTDFDKGLEIDFAYCVDEAFKKIATQEYNVVVSDYEMPEKNGLQFLESLHEQNYKIPFILFTGKGREEVAIKALNLGADGYYNKQGSPETVYGELLHGIRKAAEFTRATQLSLENQEKFQKSFEISPHACCIATLDDDVIVEVNDTYVKVFGYPSEECVGKTSLQLDMYPEDEPERQRIIAELRAKGHFNNLESLGRRKSGEIFPIVCPGTIFEIQGKSFSFTTLRDVTEEREKERIVRESEEKFSQLFKNNPVANKLTRLSDGMIFEANDAVLKLFGYAAEEVIGHTTSELGIWNNPDDRNRLIESVRSKGVFRNEEVILRKKDKTPIVVSISGYLIKIQNEDCLIASFIEINQFMEAIKKMLGIGWSR